MRFLCLAYGAEGGWEALSDERRAEVVAADEAVAATGAFVGSSIVEGDDSDEVIDLVGRTPWAVAGGAIEMRPLLGDGTG